MTTSELNASTALTSDYDLAIDIETSGFRHAGQAVRCIEAIVMETGMQYHGADQPGFTPISDMLLLIANARRLIGHNLVSFDLRCLERVLGLVVPRDRVIDTLIVSRTLRADQRELDALDPKMPAELVGRHSLDSWGWRLKIRKDDYTHYEGQPWSSELQAHCELDTVISAVLYEHLLGLKAELRV